MIIHLTRETMGWNLEEPTAMAMLSGVVMRMCGGFLSIFWRSDCEVSPVRSPTRISLARSGK